MGFEKIVARPHVCATPWMLIVVMQSLGVGSRWRCDDCGQLWVLVGNGPQNPTKWDRIPESRGPHPHTTDRERLALL